MTRIINQIQVWLLFFVFDYDSLFWIFEFDTIGNKLEILFIYYSEFFVLNYAMNVGFTIILIEFETVICN